MTSADVRNVRYLGIHQNSGRAEVFVQTVDGLVTSSELLDPRPSLKVWNHSPTGFEWGYGGSGPAQLALAILLHVADHFYGLKPGNTWRACVCAEIDRKDRPCITCEGRAEYREEGRARAVLLHQTFKWSHVARFGKSGFSLEAFEVLEMLNGQST